MCDRQGRAAHAARKGCRVRCRGEHMNHDPQARGRTSVVTRGYNGTTLFDLRDIFSVDNRFWASSPARRELKRKFIFSSCTIFIDYRGVLSSKAVLSDPHRFFYGRELDVDRPFTPRVCVLSNLSMGLGNLLPRWALACRPPSPPTPRQAEVWVELTRSLLTMFRRYFP